MASDVAPFNYGFGYLGDVFGQDFGAPISHDALRPTRTNPQGDNWAGNRQDYTGLPITNNPARSWVDDAVAAGWDPSMLSGVNPYNSRNWDWGTPGQGGPPPDPLNPPGPTPTPTWDGSTRNSLGEPVYDNGLVYGRYLNRDNPRNSNVPGEFLPPIYNTNDPRAQGGGGSTVLDTTGRNTTTGGPVGPTPADSPPGPSLPVSSRDWEYRVNNPYPIVPQALPGSNQMITGGPPTPTALQPSPLTPYTPIKDTSLIPNTPQTLTPPPVHRPPTADEARQMLLERKGVYVPNVYGRK